MSRLRRAGDGVGDELGEDQETVGDPVTLPLLELSAKFVASVPDVACAVCLQLDASERHVKVSNLDCFTLDMYLPLPNTWCLQPVCSDPPAGWRAGTDGRRADVDASAQGGEHQHVTQTKQHALVRRAIRRDGQTGTIDAAHVPAAAMPHERTRPGEQDRLRLLMAMSLDHHDGQG